jgi:hypothetical protein
LICKGESIIVLIKFGKVFEYEKLVLNESEGILIKKRDIKKNSFVELSNPVIRFKKTTKKR